MDPVNKDHIAGEGGAFSKFFESQPPEPGPAANNEDFKEKRKFPFKLLAILTLLIVLGFALFWSIQRQRKLTHLDGGTAPIRNRLTPPKSK